MNNKLPKNIILPAFFGFLFYLFITFGMNSELISKNTTFNLVALLLGVICLYATVIGIVNNRLNLDLGYSGLKISMIVFGFIIPLISIIYKYYFQESNKSYNSIIEKENIEFIVDFNKCQKVKYGSFLVDMDTVIRYSENDKDYELIKTLESTFTHKIKWIDSCSYMRYNEKNGVVKDIIRLGNFETDAHYIIVKPASFHELSDQRFLFVTEISR